MNDNERFLPFWFIIFLFSFSFLSTFFFFTANTSSSSSRIYLGQKVAKSWQKRTWRRRYLLSFSFCDRWSRKKRETENIHKVNIIYRAGLFLYLWRNFLFISCTAAVYGSRSSLGITPTINNQWKVSIRQSCCSCLTAYHYHCWDLNFFLLPFAVCLRIDTTILLIFKIKTAEFFTIFII